MKIKIPKIKKVKLKFLSKNKTALLASIIILCFSGYQIYSYTSQLQQNVEQLKNEKESHINQLNEIREELEEMQSRDEYKINQEQKEEIANIRKTYQKAVSVYEDLLKLKDSTKKVDDALDELFTDALIQLSKKDYEKATETLSTLESDIDKEQEKIAASYTIPQTVAQSNTPPGSGYSRQSVKTDAGTFLVSIIAADLASTRVIVDTAADSNCTNDCPVLPLSAYISRNGAFAGVNGSYFCPATYPSCAGKKNTFDLLVMNHKKTYFNSGNNVYSGNPAVIFGDGYIRFVTAASQWGRDTSPNGVLSNFPMLVFNNEIKFGGDDDPKKGSRGGRSFVASKGNTVYIGVVHSATVAESARAMKALGMENAMNLDNGGSTALWNGGYKVGPGRNLPNVILFVQK